MPASRRTFVSLLALTVAVAAPAATIRGTAGPDRIDVVGGGRDNVTCGKGADIVTADREDVVAADCETVSRRISFDTLTGGGAQHQTEVEPMVFGWRSTAVAAFQIGRFAAGGSAMATGWATSNDAGRTWRSGILPGVAGARVTDPVVAFDAAHGQWLVATLINGANVSAIGINRSRDGLSWSAPVFAVHLPFATITYDKEWIACDNTPASPFFGSCYLAYTERSLFTPRLAFQSSRDGGATWSAPAAATSAFGAGVLGALPLVQPNGVVTIVFNAAEGMHAVSSADGGVTFAPPVAIAAEARAAPLPVRAPTLPAGAVDAAGRVYVVWADCRFHSGCSRNTVVVSMSADGTAWTPPAAVAPGLDAFVPAVAAGAARRVAVVTNVRTPSGSYGVAVTTSRDAGATWTAPRRLDAVSPRFGWLAEADGGRFVGDYIGAAFAGGRFVPVFVLAQRPAGARLREYIAAASLTQTGVPFRREEGRCGPCRARRARGIREQ